MNSLPNINLAAIILLLPFLYLDLGKGLDTITSSTLIKDPEYVVSNTGVFKLGFFSPVNSTNRYVGIWFNQISEPTVVWVANRDKPLKDSSGVLTISENGNIVVMDGENETLWSSNVSNSSVNSRAQILDTGNLILQDVTTETTIWESFKHPCDVFLIRMKFTTNVRTNEKLLLTSSKSSSDPSPGIFSFGLDTLIPPEALLTRNGSKFWRSGPWNGQVFIGLPNMQSVYLYGFNLIVNDGIITHSFVDANDPLVFSLFLTPQGNLTQKHWDKEEENWKTDWSVIENECDVFGKCAKFGICNSERSPICSCSKGFEPENIEEWNRGNWTSGCVRKTAFQCERVKRGDQTGKEDGFLKLDTIKVPYDTELSSVSEDLCRTQCLQNCSCTAYAYRSGIGCMLWNKDLIDMQKFSHGGADLYLRLAYSELGSAKDTKTILLVSVIMGVIGLTICAYFLWKWLAKVRRGKKISTEKSFDNMGEQYQIFSSDNMNGDTLFNFEKLAAATNNFFLDNKLGEGGFGAVYKGKLSDGKEIAVKRLSGASGQGLEEFTTEVMVISKLHHRNVVRLLGCCVEGGERMLIYEFMPNKSLDSFLFDPSKQELLDWRKRFNIMEGIARGLLYLHRDSRLKIIHRDLKASNILLDEDLNPKISDFGTARIFGSNQDQAKTRRVMGTYGYMAPEYAMAGRFSEKSDVFSYGVLLLEIISGRRNTSFYHEQQPSSLLEYAWKLWTEENIMALTDPAISEPSNQKEILRCIHLGFLCVQEYAKDRPNVSTIISMLNSEIVELPAPKTPAFTERQISVDRESVRERYSINDITVTIINGR